ncbi:Cytochrome c oxidase assembly protein CtaG/Cox11 [Fragilaria crotonensis]|nr:Cytochrome c oxidase assembly protein CtaG/Cox11 [Fragilaria crotonensis]
MMASKLSIAPAIRAVPRQRWFSSADNSAQRRAYDYYKQRGRISSNNSNSAVYTVEERNQQIAWYMVAVVVGAVGATYASVPLYKIFCQATGFGGTTQRVTLQEWAQDRDERESTGVSRLVQNFLNKMPEAPAGMRNTGRVHTWTDEDAAAKLASLKPVENGRLITVRFDSTVGDILPWTFVPAQLDVKVVPGETALSFFTVTNHSDKPITGVATYNVYPPKAGFYFQKIQCFCFEEQRLLPGETVDMPVFFFIDPDFLSDSQLHHVNNLTLSYTFFQTDVDEDDDNADDEAVAA